MSFALKELAQLLTTDRVLLGSVVAVEGSQVKVATERGAVFARTLEVLVVGDRVHLRDGVATRAPIARQSYPV